MPAPNLVLFPRPDREHSRLVYTAYNVKTSFGPTLLSQIVAQFVVPSWEGHALHEGFSKYALVCTCMCQFTFTSGPRGRLVRYILKRDSGLESKDCAPSFHESFRFT